MKGPSLCTFLEEAGGKEPPFRFGGSFWGVSYRDYHEMIPWCFGGLNDWSVFV